MKNSVTYLFHEKDQQMEQIHFILTTPALDMRGKAAELHPEHSAPKGKADVGCS